MKHYRTIIGLGLVILAIAGLIFWEVKGREAILLDSVIVASEFIPAGTVITEGKLTIAGVLTENKIHKALNWDMMPTIRGKIALQDIVQNSQLSEEYLGEEDFLIRYPQSIYVLHPEWIRMRSSSIRRGDWIDIYDSESLKRIGTYRVAFVKDANEIEVTDGEGRRETNPLNRISSNSSVNHVEIISDMDNYMKILESISEDRSGLLLVQKEVLIK